MRLELARGLSTASLDLNKFSAKLVYILYYFRVTLQNAPYKNNRGEITVTGGSQVNWIRFNANF